MCIICRGENIDGVTSLVLSGCRTLKKISYLPNGLTYLDCSSTFIETIVDLPDSVVEFKCNHCPELEYIPKLSNSLRVFSCRRCFSVKELPTLPSQLSHLDCSFTRIKNIDSFPNTLSRLEIDCCYFLTSIALLPDSLTYLCCSRCYQLKSLPNIPPNLQYLYCVLCVCFVDIPKYTQNMQVFFNINCPWLKDNPLFEKNMKKLETLQRFIKSSMFRRRLEKRIWMKQGGMYEDIMKEVMKY